MIYLVPLLILASLVFWTGLDAPFVLDDLPRIVENLDLRSWDALISNLVRPYSPGGITFGNDPSRPLVYLIYGFVYQIWGPNPAAFHSVNLGVHLLNGALLWSWLNSASRRWLDPLTTPPKILATAFFLLAPIHAHTVLYAYALSDLLGTTWLLLFLCTLSNRDRPRWQTARLALFLILGLATKQSSAIFPIIYLAHQWFFPAEEPSAQRPPSQTGIVLMAILGAYLGGRYLLFGAIGDLEGRAATRDPTEYFLFQPVAIATYLRLTFWPFGLSFDHAMEPGTTSWIQWVVAYLTVGCLAITPFLCRFLFPSLVGRSIGWLIALYGLILAPTSSFLPTVDYVVERRVYSPNVALMALLAIVLHKTLRRAPQKAKVGISVFLGAMGCLLIWRSAQRIELRRNERQLWLSVQDLYPQSPRSHIALGALNFREGDYQATLDSLAPMVRTGDYMAIVTTASVYAKEGTPHYQPQVALELYKKAMESHPHMALAPYAMGRLYQSLGQDPEAEIAYKKALHIDPRHGDALNNLGTIYFQRGLWKEAEEVYRTLLEIWPAVTAASPSTQSSVDPSDPNLLRETALINLATVYAKTKRWDESRELIQKASLATPFRGHIQSLLSYLHEHPDSPDFSLEKAESYARSAIDATPQSAAFRFNLARIVQRQGRLEEAQRHYKIAASLDPKDPDILQSWGYVERALGHETEAIRILRDAVNLRKETEILRHQ